MTATLARTLPRHRALSSRLDTPHVREDTDDTCVEWDRLVHERGDDSLNDTHLITNDTEIDAETMTRLVKKADYALYEAKETGRNRLIRWSEELLQKLRRQSGRGGGPATHPGGPGGRGGREILDPPPPPGGEGSSDITAGGA